VKKVPYSIHTDDATLSAFVRRIAAEQIDNAVRGLSRNERDLPHRIHEARKTVKKLRGLIRLMRPSFAVYRMENDALRAAGQAIASLRDAQVMLVTYDEMARIAGVSDVALRESLAARISTAENPECLAAAVQDFSARMTAIRDRSQQWKVKGHGFGALEGGLERSFAAARMAQRAAARAPDDPEAVHTWRKRVKDHWYQARLLCPIWPDMMLPTIAAADMLGETLGAYNDLSTLIASLPPGPTASAITKAASERQTVLMTTAHPLSRRLFAGPPEAAVARWRAWWDVWQAA
jgi:CHAD domain-containing protein